MKPKSNLIIESDDDDLQTLNSQFETPSQHGSIACFGSPCQQPLTNHTSCNSSEKGRREAKIKKRQDKTRLKREQHKRKSEKQDKKTLALMAEYQRLQNQRQVSQTEWERIEKQQFKPLTETDKSRLDRWNDQVFLENWDGFSSLSLDNLLKFSLDCNPEVLCLDKEFNPQRVAFDVLMSFAFHLDHILLPENQRRIEDLREEIKKFEGAKKMVKHEEELRKEFLRKQTKSQLWRLLNMSLNGALSEDVLYRKGDESQEGCHVCFKIEESLVNQIVLCNKCGLRVHQCCYGIRQEQIQNFECNRCQLLEKIANVERKYKSVYEIKQDRNLKTRDEKLKNFYFNSVPCSICQNSQGAMVRNCETQEWFHVLCVLLHSHKYNFKEIENIKSCGVVKNKVQKLTIQQSSPSYSNSTLAEQDCCQICKRSQGIITRFDEFCGHLMCAILKGYKLRIQRKHDIIEVKEVSRDGANRVMQSLYNVSEKCPEVVWEDY